MPMTDKERILTQIVRDLARTYHLPAGLDREYPRGFRRFGATDDEESSLRPHFAPPTRAVKTGDLVVSFGSGIHAHTVGYATQRIASDEWMIREIGSDRLCRIENDSFIPIIGMDPGDLWERDEYAFAVKVEKAFKSADEHEHRAGGMRYKDGEAVIAVRQYFGGLWRHGESVPYLIRIPFNPKATIKSILAAMREQGFGTRTFAVQAKPGEEDAFAAEQEERRARVARQDAEREERRGAADAGGG